MRSGRFDYSSIVKPIGDNIYNIDIPIPHDLKNFNLYVLLGKEPTLIDTGPYHPTLEEVVTGCLNYLGMGNSRIFQLSSADPMAGNLEYFISSPENPEVAFTVLYGIVAGIVHAREA